MRLPLSLKCAAGDELVATELIFGGVLADLEPEEAVALLSALVFQVGRGGAMQPAVWLAAPVSCDTLRLCHAAGIVVGGSRQL